MMTEHNMVEYQKMVRGEEYNACDAYLIQLLNKCKDDCWEYNQIRPTDLQARNLKLQQMLGTSETDTFIVQPFWCDYGTNIHVGKRFFANFNWTVLDEAPVTIGDDCFIGPKVGIYPACHSTNPEERNTRREWAKPVTIGHSVWIGGGVVERKSAPVETERGVLSLPGGYSHFSECFEFFNRTLYAAFRIANVGLHHFGT